MADTPIGVEVSSPAATPTGSAAPSPASSQSSAAVAEPSIIDVDDNALIRIKGSDKPVKFGEHVRGFQSQWTKAAQKASQLEGQLRERDARLQEIQRQQEIQAQRGQQGQQPDVFEALRALPYLTGQDAASVVQSIGEQIRQRDMVLLGALKQLQAVQKMVGGLHESSSGAAFEAKIGRWLQSGGYPPEAADLAKEIYLAYEGDDLDEEFPRIFEERWNQVEKLVEARRQAKVREARPRPFIPGRGGDGKPSKPLELAPNASAADIADLLFPTLQGNET